MIGAHVGLYGKSCGWYTGTTRSQMEAWERISFVCPRLAICSHRENGDGDLMEHIQQVSKIPDLEGALLIAAFSGWNDAASAASWAIKFLINQWDAKLFAEVEPELFYDFTESRPRVRISNGAARRLSWPANRFYAHQAPRSEDGPKGRDVVLLLGEEPQMRWKTFAHEVLDVCRQCQVEEIVLLGALVAEVPHTAPVHISGTATEQVTLRQLEELGVERANYEGTTGVLSVIQDIARKEGFPATGLWGAAPHYVSATPNLPVSEALLEKLNGLYHFDLRLDDLVRAARRFTARVSSLVEDDPEVSAYVHELERRGGGEGTSLSETIISGDASGIHSIPTDGELPSPEEAIQDVEEWLRQFRNELGRDE